MPFQSGNCANPAGRPPGSRNKRDAEIWARLEARGDLDPADFLSSIATNPQETKELRVQAANFLLPYKYAKRGAIPQPPEPTYWEVEIRIQRAMTVAQGRENLQLISELKLQGRISEQRAETLFAEHNKIIDALIEEAMQYHPFKQRRECDTYRPASLNACQNNGNSLSASTRSRSVVALRSMPVQGLMVSSSCFTAHVKIADADASA
jgi:hypothetical protein